MKYLYKLSSKCKTKCFVAISCLKHGVQENWLKPFLFLFTKTSTAHLISMFVRADVLHCCEI